MKGRKRIVLVTIGLLLLSLLTTSALAASGPTKVSTFEELKAALEDSKTKQIELTTDINMTEPVYIDGGKSRIAIDGKGYALTAHGEIYFSQGKQKISLELSNMAIAYSGEEAFVSEESESRGSAQITFRNVFYNGGSMVCSPNAEVMLEDCSGNLNSKADASSFIKAKYLTLVGAVNLHDDYTQFGAATLNTAAKLSLKNDASVEIVVKAKEPSTASRYGGTYLKKAGTVLAFSEDATVSVGRVKDVSIIYEGLDLCTHEHDEVCGGLEEGGICTHVCAKEKYACCLNVLMPPNEKLKFRPANSYNGEFEVTIRYLDGEIFESSELSSITYDSLCGAVELHITFVPAGFINVSGKIVWQDEKNKYDTRPKNVEVVLFRDGAKTDNRLTVKEGKFTFKGVPEKRNGVRYDYTLRLVKNLRPLYKTEYNHDTNTIINKLVLHDVVVKHIDLATDKPIVKAEQYKVPGGRSLTVKPLNAKEYPQYKLANEDAAITYDSVDEDMTITLYYNEMVQFKGKHTFNEGEGSARGTKDVRFGELRLQIYQNVMGPEGLMPQPDDLGILLGEVVVIDTKKKDSVDYETPFSWYKHDEDGFEYIYTLVVDPETPHYTQEFTVDEEENLNIESILEDVTVDVTRAYYDDRAHTGANGESATPKAGENESYVVKYGAKVSYTAELTWNDLVLSGIRAKCGSTEVDTYGVGNSIEDFPAMGDVEITAAYVNAE